VRVLLLTHGYEPEIGAPQQRWGSLVARFQAAGHQVEVLAPPPHFPSGQLVDPAGTMHPGMVHDGRHGERVHRVRFRPYAEAVGSRLLDQMISSADSIRIALTRFRKERPDVVIATAPAIPTIVAGAAVARALRVPLITEMRDAWPDLLTVANEWNAAVAPSPRSRVSALSRPHIIRAASTVTAALQRKSSAVVATTETFATALRSRGVGNVHVIRNGAHPVPSYPHHVPRRPDGELHVLYLGTVGRAQGLGSAILAARQAHAAGVRIHLRIVGAGAEFDAVKQMAEKGDVHIEMLDLVPKHAVAEHYAWADTVLVHLRPWPALSLAVPSKLYEAMSIGIHVTAVLAGEAAKIIRDTGAGSVVPPGDPEALAETWAQLAKEPGRLHIGDGGRQWTDVHANDDTLAADYLALLDTVAKPCARTHA